jgi:hypothetical protein
MWYKVMVANGDIVNRSTVDTHAPRTIFLIHQTEAKLENSLVSALTLAFSGNSKLVNFCSTANSQEI